MNLKAYFATALPPGSATVPKPGHALTSPAPPPSFDLSGDELEIYGYICEHLCIVGIEHMTSGITIAVTARTLMQYHAACRECEEKGRSQTSKTGWATPTPWADDEKRLKMELGQWLPKLCLTIPSLARVRKDSGDKAGQDDLFADLVNHGTNSPRSASLN